MKFCKIQLEDTGKLDGEMLLDAAYWGHQVCWSAHELPPGSERPFLFRIEHGQRPTIYMLTKAEVLKEVEGWSLQFIEFEPRIQQGDTLRCLLHACLEESEPAPPGKSRGIRRDLITWAKSKDTTTTKIEAVQGWFDRRHERLGFQLLSIDRCAYVQHQIGKRRPGGKFPKRIFDLELTIQIRNPEAALSTLAQGIGGAKGFGGGLLVIESISPSGSK